PTDRWFAARDLHKFADSVWPVLGELEWQEGGKWLYTKAISNGVIDSIYSTTFDPENTWVEISRFTSATGEDYYFLVNRRSAADDDQNVVIQLTGVPGTTTFYDVSTGTPHHVRDSCGVVKFETFMRRAWGKLLKIDYSPCIAGPIDGELCSQYSYGVNGDLTVESGNVLTIRSPNLIITPNTDITSGGNDPNKVEIIVDPGAELRIEGQPGQRVVIGPEPPAASSAWYGIRSSGGKVVIDGAEIVDAYVGLKLQDESYDTVVNCTFETCKMYGIYNESNHAYFADDTVRWPHESFPECCILLPPSSYGIRMYLTDSTARIENCYFENMGVGISLYDHSSPDIVGCDFVQNVFYPSPVGIQADLHSDPYVFNCQFIDVGTGIKVGHKSDVTVRHCAFDSDVYPSGECIEPYLNVAIDGSGTSATCKIRDCCFYGANDYHVYIAQTAVDLGQSWDLGGNAFYCVEPGCVMDIPKDCLPIHSIYYNRAGTVSAQGNYFGDGVTIFDPAKIDTSNSLQIEPLLCAEAQGPPSKRADQTAQVVPSKFEIMQNYPNPFNPSTDIQYALPEACHVRIDVYNILGRKVNTLVNQTQSPGYHQVQWSGEDYDGNRVSSGVYMYRIIAGENVATRKMLLVK
ncbi:MAG: right-handed parallel beta-helix repeat-containing protein, partial [Candidatus Zixiibacteriota bacterium]